MALFGEVSEWLKEHAWKACVGLRLSRVRIPVSPPMYKVYILKSLSGNFHYIGHTKDVEKRLHEHN